MSTDTKNRRSDAQEVTPAELVDGIERLDFDAMTMTELRAFFDGIKSHWTLTELDAITRHGASELDAMFPTSLRRPADPADVAVVLDQLDGVDLDMLTPADVRRIASAVFRWADVATIGHYVGAR